jgi:glycyl-tRNA synthetase alpha chain
MEWAPGVKYAEVRLADEVQFSVYNFEEANVERLWRLLAEHEAECKGLLARYEKYPEKKRFPVLATYDQVLKCSHLFNLLDARGAISVTERVGVIKRVRDLAVGTARIWVDQQTQAEGAAA